MYVQVTVQFDLFQLFIHDTDPPPAVDEMWLVEELNHLCNDTHIVPLKSGERIKFVSREDSGRDRLGLYYQADEYAENIDLDDTTLLPAERPASVMEVKHMLPARVCEIIRQLNAYHLQKAF